MKDFWHNFLRGSGMQPGERASTHLSSLAIGLFVVWPLALAVIGLGYFALLMLAEGFFGIAIVCALAAVGAATCCLMVAGRVR